jgi:HEPN domain-containing protein
MEGLPEGLAAALREHIRGREPPPLHERIFRSARDWHASSHRALEWRAEGAEFDCLINQGLVQQAFACELYLKALFTLMSGKDPERGHDLDKLFEPLSEEARGKIKERYLARYAQGSIPDDLRSFSRYFQDWRYSYEIKGEAVGDLAGIAHLASALYETCVEISPGLLREDEVHDRIISEEQGIPIHDDLAAKLEMISATAKPLGPNST